MGSSMLLTHCLSPTVRTSSISTIQTARVWKRLPLYWACNHACKLKVDLMWHGWVHQGCFDLLQGGISIGSHSGSKRRDPSFESMALLSLRPAGFGRFSLARRCRRKSTIALSGTDSTSDADERPEGRKAAVGSSKEENPSRRTVTVEFTCDICGTRNAKKVNPKALVKGTVYVQCDGCEKYHRLVDNLNWWGEEYDLRNEASEGDLKHEE